MKRKISAFFILVFFILQLSLISSISIGVHVPEKYTEVNAGERFYFEIDIKYPENPSRKDLRLEYEILDRGGKLISQAKVLKTIETQASFIDFLVVPGDADSGLYLIKVNVKDYEDLDKEVNSSFKIISNRGGELRTYFLILLFAIIFVGILVSVSLFRGHRK